MDTNILTREYNKRTFYDCFNSLFPYDCVIPDLNLPPITINDRACLHKRERYTSYLLPATISVASENSVINLTTPSDFP